MPDWIPSSACCQVNRVTERFGSDKNSCRPLLAKTATLTLGLHTVCIMDHRPDGVKPARQFDAKSMYAMKNIKRNICWTFKDLLLYVPSLISQIRSSAVFLFSITSKISIIGFIYSNERRVNSVLVKLKLKLHNSSILAPFFSDGSNANVSREEPKCRNDLLKIVLASGTLKMVGQTEFSEREEWTQPMS